MCDGTILYIETLKSTRGKVVEIFGEPIEEHSSDHGPSVTFLVFANVAGGGYDSLVDLARSGLAFLAAHGDGDHCLGATFAACDGALARVNSPGRAVMAIIDPKTLAPIPDETARLRLWRETRDSVVALFTAAAADLVPTRRPSVVQPRTVRRRRRTRRGRS